MRLIIQPDYLNVSKWAANYIASKINKASIQNDNPFVLGLPTGSSALGIYHHLIDLFNNRVVSFRNVITFNMDEYVGLPQHHEQSYSIYMWNNFFSHIDILSENVNILNGNANDLQAECENYEAKMEATGGVDLFMGGVGEDGHLAFNEPASSLGSRTRQKTLTTDTLLANSRFFDNNVASVPKTSLTVGIGTIMDAKEIIIIASGHHKARALRHAVEEPVNQMWTISALQFHPKVIIVCDYDACVELKVGTYNYFIDIEKDSLDPTSLLTNLL
jgi:glucosamine-6-phosphate deaminase